jgi:PleD family two-component response regulator
MADKPRILVADDDGTVRSLLELALTEAGFSVKLAQNGQQAMDLVETEPVDLLLLDVEMPVMDGWAVVKRIKSDPLLRNLPVLMLTSLSAVDHRVQGLNLGANDYIPKPFELAELVARVRASLRNMQSGLESNPLSRLPGNTAIEHEILERLKAKAKLTVLYADINNFKAYNDRYGFLRGDQLIQATARLISKSCGAGDFVGHVGGDDFVILTVPDRAEELCRRIIEEFDKQAPAYYDPDDRAKGFVEIENRRKVRERFPLVGIGIGGVTNSHRELTSLGQISEIGAEMKKFAKGQGRSAYAFDRRTN